MIRFDASILRVSALSACLFAAVARAATPTPVVRDHTVVQASSSNALAKYDVENLHTVPLAPRTPIPSLEVEFRCPTCSSNESLKGVTVEIWFSAGGAAPRLVGSRYNVELKGKGGACTAHDSSCFGVPTGQFPAAEGAFTVKLIKGSSVSSSSFNVVPSQLKIFGPTLRDHR